MNKINNKLIENFSDISDVELTAVYKKTIHDYKKYKVIEKLVLEIIYDLGYSKKLPINHELENRYKAITKVAEARKLILPRKLGKVVIKKADVISQIEEMKELETKWIEEHSYLYDGFYDGLEYDHLNSETKKNSLDRIEEIQELYSKVITIIDPEKKVKTK